MKQISEKVTINGEEYELEGNIDFSNISITKVDSNVPDPEPPVDTGKPSEGLIKPGGWGADLANKDAWKVIAMKDNPALFKIVDAAGKNVATNFTAKEVAESFIAYYKTHPFPPTTDVTPEPTPTPTPDPTPQPQPGGNNVTKDGVQLIYSPGKNVLYQYKDNFRDDGKRYDFNGLKQGEFVSSELVGYFKFTQDPVDDEISGKFSYMSHSGSNNVQCYDAGCGIRKGDTRFRFENPHPSYSGNLAKGIKNGVPLNDKWIGYKFVKKVEEGGNILLEIYQDAGDNETKPSNTWEKLFTHLDTKYKKSDPPDGHQITLRVDDPAKKGQKNLQIKWVCLAEI